MTMLRGALFSLPQRKPGTARTLVSRVAVNVRRLGCVFPRPEDGGIERGFAGELRAELARLPDYPDT